MMKWTAISLVAAAQLATCLPQAPSAPQPAPANCRKLPTDSDWPKEEVWKAALKGVEARGPQNPKAKRPDYKYEANTVAKVQNAVKFAATNNVRLSILNSGHDFIGRNDAPSGLSLLITELKGIRVLESFTPTAQGAEPVDYKTKSNTIKLVPGKQAAATIGGGVNIDELNAALRPSGLYSIGAAHGEVGVAGGWIQAGGHAALSSYYGLGADQALEFKVVTADGQLKVANSVVNQDLFWALRGGGGGTYGVVVEATIKVYPSPKILSYSFWLNTTDYDDHKSIFAPAAYMCSQIPRLNQVGGIQGYFYIHPNAISGMFLAPNEYANASQITGLWDPILDKMKSYPGIDPKTLIKIPPISFGAAGLGSIQGADGGQAANPGSGMGGMNMMVRRHGPGEMEPTPKGIIDEDSRLLGEEELTSEKLAEALEKAMPPFENPQLRSHLVGGGKVMKLGNDTSVNPAWRRAYVHMMTTGNGKVNAQPLRDISPHGGAYVNEASNKQPDFKNAFWGTNYPKLLDIKQKYDPDFVFYVSPGIGADLLVAQGDRLCKVGGAIKAEVSPDGSAPDSDNKNVGEHDKAVTSWPLLYQGKGLPPKLAGSAGGIPKMGGNPPASAAKGNPPAGHSHGRRAGM